MGKEKSKKGSKGADKFDGKGVDFKCKLIGFVNVPSPRGDDICQEAISKLKHMAVKLNKEKKEHKQKITVNITIKGIRLIDEATERIEHAHPINRISYISHDSEDKRTFGYIVGTKEGYKLFAIRTMKEAEQITKTLKELFQVVFDRHQAKKDEELAEEPGKEDDQDEGEVDEVGEEESDDKNETALADWGQLNDQIETMQNDGMTDSQDFFADFDSTLPQTTANDPFGDQFSIPLTNDNLNKQNTSNDFNPFDTNISVKSSKSEEIDFFTQTAKTNGAVPKPHSNELFSIDPPSSNHSKEVSDDSLLINDPFAELKKNINEMHKQNQQQHQQQFGYQANFAAPSPQQHPQANVFQQPPVNNPFAQNMFQGNQNTPATHQQFPVQPPLPPRNQVHRSAPPPVVNPFQQPAPTEPDNGWTVTKKPVPVARVVKPTVQSSGPDPFAFLNEQTGLKATSAPAIQPMAGNQNFYNTVPAVANGGGNANNELLDFLG